MTGVRSEECRKDADGRRLPGAVRPKQPEDAALRYREVESVERPDLELAGLVDLDEALGSDDVHAAANLGWQGQGGRGVYGPTAGHVSGNRPPLWAVGPVRSRVHARPS